MLKVSNFSGDGGQKISNEVVLFGRGVSQSNFHAWENTFDRLFLEWAIIWSGKL